MSERYGLDVPPHERRPVPWYAPVGLRTIAQQQLWSTNLLRNLDRRETFEGRLELIDLRHLATEAEPDFWFDFVADTGDGGNPTYTVARGVLSAELAAEGAEQPLPEGRLLILGGDLAYPGASPELYQSRLVEMFELARDPRSRYRDVPRGVSHDAPIEPQHKLVAAIPQNHDWFDSASTFCRYFVNSEKAGLVGARAPQSRTYFAMALPHDWYVLGFDWALTGDLDRLQYESFAQLIESGALPPGGHVILIYPEPYWTRPFASQARTAYPLRYQRLEHLLAQHGLHVRMRLAGDLHHYSREHLDCAPPGPYGTELVTCGNGGAFGHATHCREVLDPKVLQWTSDPGAAQAELRGHVTVGRMPDIESADAAGLCFRPTQGERDGRGHGRCYPDIATSRRQAWGNVLALLRPRGEAWHRSNLTFALLLGVLLGVAGLTPTAPSDGRWLIEVLANPWSVAAHGGLVTTALFLTTDNDPVRASWGDRIWGGLLALMLMGLAWLLREQVAFPLLERIWPDTSGLASSAGPASTGTSSWSWARTNEDWHARPWALIGLELGLVTAGVVLASLVGALTVGTFLAVFSRWTGRAPTNVSSALSLDGHKGFLRFRVTAQGIEAHMLGTDTVPQRWRPQAGATPFTRPYWEPAPGAGVARWRVVDRFWMKR